MVARWDCASFALVIAVGLIFSVAEVCNGGKTSSFVRNDQLSHDMPLDSDVFRIPPGYNAPQQVIFIENLVLYYIIFVGCSRLVNSRND